MLGTRGRGGPGTRPGTQKRASTLLAAPNPATLSIISTATDNQTDFLVTAANADLPVGAVVTVYAYSDAGLTTLVDTGSGTVSVAGTLTITNQLGPLADGTYWYVARTAIAGHTTSNNSNTETGPIDATPPTLSSPTGTKTGTTTASGTVSTNEGNGTLFWVVDTGSTPSAAQVKLGKGSGGSAANGASNSQAVSATGAQPTILATGLTAGTTYKFFYMHEDAVGNQSSVSPSATSFTTDAVFVPILLTSPNDLTNAAWTNSTITATANAATAPDSTSTASRLVAIGSGNFTVLMSQLANSYKTGGVNYGVTGYLKNVTSPTWVLVLMQEQSGFTGWGCYFNLSGAGSVGTQVGTTAASITSVGSGWYQFHVEGGFVSTPAANVQFQIYFAAANNDGNGTLNQEFDAWQIGA